MQHWSWAGLPEGFRKEDSWEKALRYDVYHCFFHALLADELPLRYPEDTEAVFFFIKLFTWRL